MNDGEEMPKRYLPMKNFSNLTLKPRFDRWFIAYRQNMRNWLWLSK
jgi:hypothetical protein